MQKAVSESEKGFPSFDFETAIIIFQISYYSFNEFVD